MNGTSEAKPLNDNNSIDTETTILNFNESGSIVGETLDGRFFIERDLTKVGADAGGMGLVYLAHDTKMMGREVVVKILQKDSLQNEDILRKFEHEKEALIRLDHPNIVRILDKGKLTDGNPFMVMEYIDGYSLRKKLRENGKLEFGLIAHITEAVTRALHAANSKKIFHRDIKPENIMLTPQEDGFERVRLIDFGIARVEESQVAPVTTVARGTGTVRYIAPEQLIGSLQLTPASDIYSLGIMIYEMLTGELPFKPRSIVEMFELEKAGVQTPPSEIRSDTPPEAERILLSALEFDPTLRPQNALVFGSELAGALTAGTIEAVRPPPHVKLAERPDFDLHSQITILAGDRADAKKPISRMTLALLLLLCAMVLSITAGYAIWRNFGLVNGVRPAANQPASTVADTPPELKYFLNVQKMRDGKPFEAPFKSSGQEVYEDGYKFSMVFQANADGYMYAFNEGNDTQGKIGYYLLYPTPKNANGSAKVLSGGQIETSQNTFTGERGTEIVWLIWTKDRSDVLVAVLKSAIVSGGVITDAEQSQKLRDFIDKFKNTSIPARKDAENQQSIISLEGDTVVHKLELEHR